MEPLKLTPLRVLLHFFAAENEVKIVEYLIQEQKHDCNTKDTNGSTPLYCAAESHALEVVKYLLSRKEIDPNIPDDDKYTPLHRAIENEHFRNKGFNISKALINNKRTDINAQNSDGYTPLYLAAKYAILEIVRILVEEGANISIEDGDGKKPIDVTSSSILKFLKSKENEYNESLLDNAKKGNLGEIKSLLSKGADINAQNSNGYTPLYLAAKYAILEIVRILVEEGANISIEDRDGKKPIDVASSSILKFLKSKENEYNESLLDNAKKGNLGEIKSLLNRGADFNVKGSSGWTLLHLAALYNHLDIVEYLLENGATVDAQDSNGSTPLHFAVENGCAKVVRTLIEGKADINAKSSNGFTPLHLAVEDDNLEIVQILIENGATVDAQDDSKSTPLHLAAENDNLEIVQILIKNGATVDAQDSNGSTPLHLAAEGGYLNIVQDLVEKGANISIKDNGGKKPIDVASSSILKFLKSKENEYNESLLDNAKKGNLDGIKSLLSRGADVNTEISGFTALHFAAKFNHCELVEFLVKQEGIEINAKNVGGWTPLHLATFFCYLEVIILLLDSGADVTVESFYQETPLNLVEELLAKKPEDENIKAIEDLLFNKLNAQDQQIQSSKKQQKSLLHLSEYIGSHFHDIELKAVEQGLYLPSFEKRGVKIDGKCVAITRGLSQALLLQSNKSFLSNLETSSEIYERIAQGKQISKREKGEVFALSKLLDGFEQHLGSPTNSLPSNLIYTQGYKTFSGLSNYIAGIKSDFAIHLVTSNHVVAIYRTGNNYAYFDSNAAFVSGLKSVDQLMEVVEKGVKSCIL